MNIITVGREFGSGGRELGKRMADLLGFAYYDREIITAIAEKSRLDAGYVAKRQDSGFEKNYPVTFGRTFSYPPALQQNSTKIYVAEQQVIRELAAHGKHCVVVGRNTDVILSDYSPWRLFVYADMQSKIKRCIDRAPAEENLSEHEIKRNIRRVDANRAKHRELLAGGKWGQKECYHLCVNTTGWALKELAPLIAQYACGYFRRM